MENNCNNKMETKFYFIDKNLDLTPNVNNINKLKTFRLYVDNLTFQLLILGSNHFIKGKKYKVISILRYELNVEEKMFDMYIVFKKLKNK